LSALFALGIDYLVMGIAPTLVWLFVGRCISGIVGASYSPAYAYIADITPPEKRAQSFGFVSAAFGLGFVLGPTIGGLLGSLGPRTPFFAAARATACVRMVAGQSVRHAHAVAQTTGGRRPRGRNVPVDPGPSGPAEHL